MLLSEKSKLSALLLAFFLGGFGAHRFYVGKTGTAILMILVSLTIIGLFVTLIWSWVDIITIIFDKFTDKHGKFLKHW